MTPTTMARQTPRKIVQLVTAATEKNLRLFCVANDGSAWKLKSDGDHQVWERLPGLPPDIRTGGEA